MVGDSQISLILVSETPYSCDTVGRELKRAMLCSLLCPETDWNDSRRKASLCVFFLTDFKKRCFDVSFLTSICVNNYFETENFLNKLMP